MTLNMNFFITGSSEIRAMILFLQNKTKTIIAPASLEPEIKNMEWGFLCLTVYHLTVGMDILIIAVNTFVYCYPELWLAGLFKFFGAINDCELNWIENLLQGFWYVLYTRLEIMFEMKHLRKTLERDHVPPNLRPPMIKYRNFPLFEINIAHEIFTTEFDITRLHHNRSVRSHGQAGR